MKNMIKLICEFLPLVLFFYAYKAYGLLDATMIITIASVISLIVLYISQRKFPIIPTISALVLLITTSFTYFSGNSNLIKYKPTIVNAIFSAVLLHGIMNNKGYLRYLLDSAIQLSDENWVILSRRWMFFFLILGAVNLIVVKTMSEEIWVSFKAFGLITITILFIFTQIPFLMKNKIEQ